MGKKNKTKKNYTPSKIDDNVLSWRNWMDEMFPEVIRWEHNAQYAWYRGNSDLLEEVYLQSNFKNFRRTMSNDRNERDYFWTIASMEPNIKKTHSSLPRAIISTLVNVLGVPDSKVMKDKVDTTGKVSQIVDEEVQARLEEILKDNKMVTVVKDQQLPFGLCMGEGVYLVDIDPELSDYPVIQYVDARNVTFEIRANRVTRVFTRSYYVKEYNTYMLLQERGTLVEDDTRKAYIKYKLFRLSNQDSRQIDCEVALSTIDELASLENIKIANIDSMLAVPCIYKFDSIAKRGTPLYEGKMDLFDDLDQCLSQDSNSVRLSTPVEEIDDAVVDHDADGKPIPPNRYDRRYLVVKSSVNSVGENGASTNLTVPQIDFAKYSTEALHLVEQIILGIISPSTLGINVSKVDNGEAQREKEKHTMFTRDDLIDYETQILKDLYELVLKVDDLINHRNVGQYDIVVNFPEYGNPTFESKLNNLLGAVTSGAMSPRRFVEELWGDALTEEEKEEEIAYITEAQSTGTINEGIETLPGTEEFGLVGNESY